MRRVRYSSKFKKDLKRIKKQHKNTDLLKQIITQLANDKTLDIKYKDHRLIGNYLGSRECHLSPDWLLIYRYQSFDELILLRTGTHSDLF